MKTWNELIMDPPLWWRYLPNHCLHNIAMNAVNSDTSKLVYRRSEVAMPSLGAGHSRAEEGRDLRLEKWNG